MRVVFFDGLLRGFPACVQVNPVGAKRQHFGNHSQGPVSKDDVPYQAGHFYGPPGHQLKFSLFL